MSAITWGDVTDYAAELAVISPLAQAGILAVVNTQLNAANWGGETSPILKLARVYLAAHHATLVRRKGNGGALASEGALGISRSYAQPTTQGQYATTSYGQLFAAMAKTRPSRAGFSTGSLPSLGTNDPSD